MMINSSLKVSLQQQISHYGFFNQKIDVRGILQQMPDEIP